MELRKIILAVLIFCCFSCTNRNKNDNVRYSAKLKKIEVYSVETTSESILSSNIYSVAIGKNGYIWVGSTNGYSYLKNGKWFNHYYYLSLPKIVNDEDGEIWILLKNGIKRYLDDKIIDVKKDKTRFYYTSMTKEKNGRLWFSTRKNGIFSFYNNKWKHHTAKDNLPCDSVTSIAYDSKNKKVWVGTKKGMAYFKNGNWYSTELVCDKRYSFLKIIIVNSKTHSSEEIDTTLENNGFPPIKKIRVDKQGIVWVLTKKNSVWHYEDKKWKLYACVYNTNINDFIIDSETNTLYLATSSGTFRIKNNNIKKIQAIHNAFALSVDHQGNLWIGTCAEGLIKLNLKTLEYSTVLPKGGMPSNFVKDLFISVKDNIYVATNKGLVSFDGKKWTVFDIDTSVFSITGESDSNIWVSTSNGLKLVCDDEIRSIPWSFKNPYWSHAVVTIDNEGTMYIAGGPDTKGIYIYKNGEWSIFNTDSGLPDNDVSSIFIDGKNCRWFGSKKGLMMIKDGRMKVYNSDNGLAGNNVNSITEDVQGNLWIGTVRGLSRFNGHRFSNSFNNQNITEVTKGNYNDIWVGLENGCLWRIDINTYPQKESFSPYPKKDKTFHISSIKLDSKGNLWVGDMFNGVQRFLFSYKRIGGEGQKTVNIERDKKLKATKPVNLFKPSAKEGGWMALLHDFGRTNASTNQMVKPPFLLDWKTSVGPTSYFSALHTSPILYKGKIFLTNNEGILWTIDAATGRRLWKSVIGSHRMNCQSPMVLINGQIVIQGDDNNLNFISQKDGRETGEISITLKDMIVKDDNIYGIGKDEVIIIYTKRRKIISTIPAKGCEFISSNDKYFAVLGRSLAVYRFSDNAKIWENNGKQFFRVSPVIYKDRILTISSVMDCYELETGKSLWRIKMASDKTSPPAVRESKLYIQQALRDSSFKIICFNILNGDFIWEREFKGLKGFASFMGYSFPPLVCNGIVYVTAAPTLYALDAETGEVVWRKDISEHLIAPMIVGTERIFIPALGEMYALKTTNPGKYSHKIKKKVIPKIDKEKLIQEIEENLETRKGESSPKIRECIDEFQKLVFKGYRNYGENIRCHQLMDSLVAHNQVDVITLFIEKESLISWTVGTSGNFVMVTLLNALKAHPEFGKVLYPHLVKYTEQNTNPTLKKKAILLLGYIDDRRAVKTLQHLLPDYSVTGNVLHALCMQPNDLSYNVLRRILDDESRNMYWKQIVREIADYKKDERVKWMLEKVLKSMWADSLTKVYAENGLKKLEEGKLAKKEKTLKYVAPSSHKKPIIPVESLSYSELENFLSELFRKGNYEETYRYAIYGINKFQKTKTLLYYKGVSAYKIGEIDIGIETLILLIEEFPDYPVDQNLENILLKNALKLPKYEDKGIIIKKYFHK